MFVQNTLFLQSTCVLYLSYFPENRDDLNRLVAYGQNVEAATAGIYLSCLIILRRCSYGDTDTYTIRDILVIDRTCAGVYGHLSFNSKI